MFLPGSSIASSPYAAIYYAAPYLGAATVDRVTGSRLRAPRNGEIMFTRICNFLTIVLLIAFLLILSAFNELSNRTNTHINPFGGVGSVIGSIGKFAHWLFISNFPFIVILALLVGYIVRQNRKHKKASSSS
jgi:hypothetical protein